MKLIKTLYKIISTVLVTAIVLMAILLVGVRVVGFRPFAVLSGSMEPTYKTGSIVYVKNVDYHSLEVGDPISFMLDEKTVATHRIVEVVPDAEDPETIRYKTKGDNNDAVDGGLVHYKNVIGKVVFTLPYLGYVASYIQQPPGTYIVVAGCAFLAFLAFLPDLFAPVDESEKKDAKKAAKKGKGKGSAERDPQADAASQERDPNAAAGPAGAEAPADETQNS